MISSEEKRKLLNDIIGGSNNPTKRDEIQQKLYNLMMQDTNGGKLYKYRSFDENDYSIRNFEEGTLHCSSPEGFNDPFDFKIGIDLQSLYTFKYSREIEIIGEAFDGLYDYTNGSLEISKCSDEVLCILKAFSANDVIMHLVDFIKETPSQEERVAYIKKNPTIIEEILNVAVGNLEMKEAFGITQEMLPGLMKCLYSEKLLQENNSEQILKIIAEANGIVADAD